MKPIKLIQIIVICFIYSPLSAQFESAHFIDTTQNCFSANTTKVVDLNNDGLDDIILGQHTPIHRIGYYLNEGNGNFSDVNIVDTSLSWIYNVESGDFNNDGFQDVLGVTSIGWGTVYWFENDNLNFGPKQIIDSTSDMPHDAVVADFNGD